MRILISGARGLLGAQISRHLGANGHLVVPLARRASSEQGVVVWRPEKGDIDRSQLSGFDAVIHLAGEPIRGLWTSAKKQAIKDSRIQGTTLLARTMAELGDPPRAFLCASATGYYGDQGEAIVDETCPAGTNFLAHVCQQWEEACRPASEAGIRVVHLRLPPVLAREGGMLQTMLPLFRLGLGGRLGSGRQWQSWIEISDVVAAVVFLLDHPVQGPVNLSAPEPVRNDEMTRLLATLLRRPAIFHVPEWVLRALLREMAENLILTSCRARPEKLLAAGFQFQNSTMANALSSILIA
jgi:uncharacterized protein (TIGR01777 family)